MFKYVKRYWPAAAAAVAALALPAMIWAVEATAVATEVAETACCCCPLCCL